MLVSQFSTLVEPYIGNVSWLVSWLVTKVLENGSKDFYDLLHQVTGP